MSNLKATAFSFLTSAALVLSVGSAAAADKTYCAPNDSLWQTAFQQGFQDLAQEWIRFERDLQTSHTNFFIRTGAASTSAQPQQTTWKNLEAQRTRLRDLFQRTRVAAERLPSQGQAQLARFVVRYLELGKNLLYQQLAVWPFSNLNMQNLEAAYQIKIPASLFAIIQQELAPQLSSLVLQESAGQVSIRFSKSEILALGIRALASSPIALRQVTKAYGQTVRCLMARESSYLFVRNELRLEDIGPNAAAYTQPICRGLSIKDMVGFELPSQTIPWRIAALKENLVSAVPTYNTFIRDAAVAKALEAEITWQGRKFTVNTDPAYVYLYATQEDFPEVNIDKVRSTVQNAVIDVSESNSKLAALYDFTHTQQVLGELNKVVDQCGLGISATTFAEQMSEAETVYTLDSYDRALQHSIPLHDDGEKPKQFLRRVFFQQKVESLTKAFRLALLAHLPAESDVDVDALVDSFALNAVYPAVSYLSFKSATDQKAMDELADSLLAGLSKNGAKATAQSLRQKDFMDRLLKSAGEARRVMDPATPLNQLPYMRSIIWDYYAKDLEGVSRLSKKRVQALGKSNDPAELKSIFEKVRGSLNSELSQLGYYGQEGVASRTFNYLKSFVVREDPKKVRADALRHDIDVLDQMSFRLGFNGSNGDRKNLQEALVDQRLGQSDTKKFVQHYRKALLALQVGEFRLLDMPMRSGKALYQILGAGNAQAHQNDVHMSLQKVRDNLKTHLARINAAKSILDMKPYIVNSDLLQVTLGLGDLSGAIAANDLLRLTGISEIPSFTMKQDVFGPLLDQHYRFSSAWQRERALNGAVWDELFSSALIGSTPFVAGWLTKLGFAYAVPARFGGRAVPGAINSIYQKTIGQWGHYWNFIYALVGVDIGMSSYKLYSTHRELGLLDEFSYTDSEKRALLFSDSYLSRKMYLEKLSRSQMLRIGHNVFWIAFPYITQAAITKVYRPMQARRVSKQEKLLTEAIESGAATPAHLRAQANVQKNAVRTFDVLARNLHYEFKALGVPDGTFAISRLQQGLREARQSKDVFRYMRAKQAYERIVRATTEALIPFVGAEHVGAAYIRASVGTVDEYNAMVNIYNRLIQLEARRRQGAA